MIKFTYYAYILQIINTYFFIFLFILIMIIKQKSLFRLTIDLCLPTKFKRQKEQKLNLKKILT